MNKFLLETLLELIIEIIVAGYIGCMSLYCCDGDLFLVQSIVGECRSFGTIIRGGVVVGSITTEPIVMECSFAKSNSYNPFQTHISWCFETQKLRNNISTSPV